ncbi:hypothetical protein ABZ871_22950 [Streptomyces populi]
MNDIRCAQCGAVGLEPGFVEDSGQGARGFARWVQGALERGPLGGAKLMGRPRRRIDAFRRPDRAHLELSAARRS